MVIIVISRLHAVNFEMSDGNSSPKSNNDKTTPPTNQKIKNPFDSALIDRLHMPICSPGMCKIYKKRPNESFCWDIDQACTLVPADIVACNSQFEPSPDPIMEKIADEATKRFFSQEMIMPSPLESSKKVISLPLHDASSQVHGCVINQDVLTKDVSAQTALTLPPTLPSELESVLQKYSTFTQDQNFSGEYEITANGSLCRKILFEEHIDPEHYDSEQTDDEIHVENRPPSSYDHHAPVVVSPDLCCDLVAKGMKRTFGTPLSRTNDQNFKTGYRNKILDLVAEPCLSPIQFATPNRKHLGTMTPVSSTSPPFKATSSDENNQSSPVLAKIENCKDCKAGNKEIRKWPCFCKSTPSPLTRSTSLKDSPWRRKNSSFSGKRSLSMSSLNRSRSVQRLDFSIDMSLDDSVNDKSPDVSMTSNAHLGSDSALQQDVSWCMEDDTSIYQLVQSEDTKKRSQELNTLLLCNTSNINDNHCFLDETPVKVKKKKENIFT